MPIPIPVTKTKISTLGWGIPMTNEVNRLTALTLPTAWTTPAFLNGWGPYLAATSQGTQYRKIGDIVYLRGNMANGALGSDAFTLPVGFRPPGRLFIAAIVAGGVLGYVVIDGSGAVVPNGSSNLQISTDAQFSITP